jgi:hypothetical protein
MQNLFPFLFSAELSDFLVAINRQFLRVVDNPFRLA